MTNISVTTSRVNLSAPVTVQSRPPIQITAVSAQAPLMPVQVTLERKAITVEVVTGAGAPASSTFTHTQSTPAAVWTIPNTLGAKAIVLAVYDSAGRVGIADVTVTDTNTVISFSSPRTGRVDYIRS